MSWFALFLGTGFNSAAHLLLKTAASVPSERAGLFGLIEHVVQPAWIGGVLCFGFSVLCYTYVLTKLELSVAQPVMTSLALVLVFVFSLIFFQESFHWMKVLGGLSILVGIFLLTSSS